MKSARRISCLPLSARCPRASSRGTLRRFPPRCRRRRSHRTARAVRDRLFDERPMPPLDPVRQGEYVALLRAVRDARRAIPQTDLEPSSPAAIYREQSLDARGTALIIDRVILVADLWTLIAAEQAG